MNENSPICARLTAIVSPVSSDRPNTRTIASAASDLPTTMIASVASTGTKYKEDQPWKYVAAFAGSDIETNPPGTNKAVQESGQTFSRKIDELPPAAVVAEIKEKVCQEKLEETLMREGIARAKRRGHKLMLLVGDAPYYARVGFRKLPENLLLMPGPVDPERFLYLELEPGALDAAHGLVLPPHRFKEKSMRTAWSPSSGGELLALTA